MTNSCTDYVTAYPLGSSGNVTPLSRVTALAQPAGIARDSSGRIYVTNACNSTITVYAPDSKGNVAPIAAIGGPNTGLATNYTGFSPLAIALDSSGKIYVANPADDSIAVFAPGSNGNVKPIATIGGQNTGLFPQAIAVDSNGKIYVANFMTPTYFYGTVTVYPAGSNGNVKPIATIGGSNTGLGFPEGIALGSKGEIYVTNRPNSPGGSVTVYPAGSNGDVKPIATISGSNTGLNSPLGIALDSNGKIYVANDNFGRVVSPVSVTVYSAGSTGNVKPIATIGGSDTGLASPYGIALDSKGKIYVTNITNASVTMYAPGSNGNVPPIATISDSNTGLTFAWGIALDSKGKIYVANNGGASVTVYPAGSNGNVPPTATISGSKTGFISPQGIALDSKGKIYVTDGASSSIVIYAPGSNGDVKPIATISGSNTGLGGPAAIAADSSGKIYVTNTRTPTYNHGSVTVYRAGSNGNVPPIATIGGSNTLLTFPRGIALDSNGGIYVTNYVSYITNSEGYVTVYAAGSNGNVAPIAVITDSHQGIDGLSGIALGSNGEIYVANSLYQSITVYTLDSNGIATQIATISGANTGLAAPMGIAIGR